MIRVEGERLVLEGEVNIGTVPGLLEATRELVSGAVREIDFAHASEIDSSAVALIFEWSRTAAIAGRALAFVNLPPAITNLAALYGVTDLFPVGRR